MLKIFLKSAILVFIILSIYFIVNPSACSNLLAGRVVNTPREDTLQINNPSMPAAQNEMLIPVGDQNAQDIPSAQEVMEAPQQPQAQEPAPEETAVAISTPQEAQEKQDNAPVQEETSLYTQEDIDYAVASRYVELEREYLKENKTLGKEASREISYIVMDDFEMSPEEWESFLTRATSSGLFNKVREEMPQ